MTELNYLVLLDTDRIKEYLFATNKLKEIQGASTILDRLNQQETPNILYNMKYRRGNLSKEADEYVVNWSSTNALDWQMVYFGGGAVQIFFNDEEKANQFCADIEKLYQNQTDAIASTTGVVVERKPEEEFKDWVRRGHKSLRKRKDAKYLRLQPLSNPHFKFCESSGTYIAETYDYSATPRFVHRSVRIKRDEKGEGFIGRFKRRAEETKASQELKWQKIQNAVLPNDLNEIGVLSNGYVGFVYADGNRMGSRFQSLNCAKEYSKLSKGIQTATENAIFDTILKRLHLIEEKEKCRLPFQILMLGGDDLMFVVPANKAIEIAIDFCDMFKSYTTDETYPQGISISAGVLISHANYPIHLMMTHGEELLKSAKTKSNKLFRDSDSKNEVCTIDYMVLKGALLKALKKMRQESMTIQSFSPREPVLRLYQRPYTTEELANLIHWIKKLKSSGFPHSRLKSIYRSFYRSRTMSTLDFLLMLSRLEKKTRENINQFFQDQELSFPPWKRDSDGYVTPLVDLIELYDFIDKEDAS